MLSIGRIACILTLMAVATAGIGQDQTRAPTPSVCEVLSNRAYYVGKEIEVRGNYIARGHDSILAGEGCWGIVDAMGRHWPSAIHIASGKGIEGQLGDIAILQLGLRMRRELAKRGGDVKIAKTTLTLEGTFEAVGPDARVDSEEGFGDRGYSPGQIRIIGLKDVAFELRPAE